MVRFRALGPLVLCSLLSGLLDVHGARAQEYINYWNGVCGDQGKALLACEADPCAADRAYCADFGAEQCCVEEGIVEGVRSVFCCGGGESDHCPTPLESDNGARTHCRQTQIDTNNADTEQVQGLCLPSRDYCQGEGMILSSKVLLCHMLAAEHAPEEGGTGSPSSWALGDCDQDGLGNAHELVKETDPCLAPGPELGLYDDARGDCRPILGSPWLVAGRPGRDCDVEGVAGTIQRLPDNSATICAVGPYCQLQAFDECAEGLYPHVGVEGESICLQNACPALTPEENVQLALACHTNAAGEVDIYAHGDCDGDGSTNYDDFDPCRPGPPDHAMFRGGGGAYCSLAITAPSHRGPSLLLSILALGLIYRRRRRD